jgi:E1A-binding protein p400
MLQQELSSCCALLHPIASAMVTQFPDPRLIQYDCGELLKVFPLHVMKTLGEELRKYSCYLLLTLALDRG